MPIAFCSFGSIVGSLAYSARLQFSAQRRSSAGIARGSSRTGAGRLLYCLVILRHGRRLWVSFGVTTNPTAEWISRQIIEAFPWDSAPRYLIRHRDTVYGPIFV